MIKAVIFDLGKVIVDFDDDMIFFNRLSKHTDKSPEEIRRLSFDEHNLKELLETGNINFDDFYSKIKESCNLDINKEEFTRAYSEVYSLIKSTVEVIKKLKLKYKIGLISNTSEFDYNYIMDTFGLRDLFDVSSLSFQLGIMKPDTRIFKDCLSKLDVKPEEAVYVDDIKEFVYAFNALGGKGIQYKSVEDISNIE